MAEIVSLSQVTSADVRQAIAWLASEVSAARASYQANFNAYRFNAASQTNDQRQRTAAALQRQAQGLQQLEEWLATAQQRARDYGLSGLGVAPLAIAGVVVIVALLLGLTTAFIINQLNQQKAIAAAAQQQANVKDLIGIAQQAAANVQNSNMTPDQKAIQQQQILNQAAAAAAAAGGNKPPDPPSQIPTAAVALAGIALVGYFVFASE